MEAGEPRLGVRYGEDGKLLAQRHNGRGRGYSRWHEPLVGHLFGNLYYERAGHRSEDGIHPRDPPQELGSVP